MNPTIDAVYEEALSLDDDDRIALVERLLGSMDVCRPLEEEQLAVVRGRMEELESGRVEAVPVEMVFREVRAAL